MKVRVHLNPVSNQEVEEGGKVVELDNVEGGINSKGLLEFNAVGALGANKTRAVFLPSVVRYWECFPELPEKGE